jgi:hypothetical protein
MPSYARISRVHGSWRVRVYGHPTKFFADSKHGGKDAALQAAIQWRDARWDGKLHQRQKLTPRERAAIRRSKRYYKEVAEQYGISPTYVHQIRRGE